MPYSLNTCGVMFDGAQTYPPKLYKIGSYTFTRDQVIDVTEDDAGEHEAGQGRHGEEREQQRLPCVSPCLADMAQRFEAHRTHPAQAATDRTA